MKLVYRVITYVFGLFLISMGVAFSVNCNLGVSPVNSFPYVISQVFHFDFGNCVTAVFLCYVLLQILLLRREFKLKNLLQMVFATLFGYFVDLSKLILGDFAIPTYAGKLLMLAISILLIAVGITFYLEADIVPLPMEGLAMAVTAKLRRFQFHNVKVALDCTSVILATALSLIALHTLVGLREGTFLSALLVGKVMALIGKPVKKPLHALCYGAPQPKAAEPQK